jgi:three-Cys-motif partner protein
MTAKQLQIFGGGWTEEKLEVIKKYLSAYTTALKNKGFELVYIDAFAGTGYREAPPEGFEGDLALFAELVDDEPQRFLEGSVQIALQTQPPFARYVFGEKDPAKLEELEATIAKSGLADRVDIYPGDANAVILEICEQRDWHKRRAVLFLDPFGMQVSWETIEAVARTKAIDVWVLFPVGAVNRLLKRSADVPQHWADALTRIFGTEEWRDRFYRTSSAGLFEGISETEKTCGFDGIALFWNERLATVFPGVADNPKMLYNSTGAALFSLSFGIANPAPKALRLAKKIAEDVLRSV